MNAHTAMKMKMEILAAMGASPEMIGLYCPEIPPMKVGEVTDADWPFAGFVTAALTAVEDTYRDEVGVFINDAYISRTLCLSDADCPYCNAHRRFENAKLGCHGCSYGEMYGECSYESPINADTGWGSLQMYVRSDIHALTRKYVDQNDTLSNIRGIADKYEEN